MNKIEQLRARRESLRSAENAVRASIAALVDEDSFVELAAFAYSKSELWQEEAHGEGVAVGFATIGGYPFYLVAQNFDVCYGGLSKANCDKISKALAAAEKSGTPVVYLLHSFGVRIGEGVNVLEGIGQMLSSAARLKGSVLQFAILDGEVYGSAAALASVCDAVLFTEKAALCLSSPFVLSAKAGKNLSAVQVGGYAALDRANFAALSVKDLRDAASKILNICDFVKAETLDAELNAPCPALNSSADAKAVLSLLEGGVELGANAWSEAHTVLARLGGIAVAAVVMEGVRLTAGVMNKIAKFVEFACNYDLPLVFFVDCAGVEETCDAQNSGIYEAICDYLTLLGAADRKIAAVTGNAIGLGYSLFAAKSAGFDYTFALATAKIALFDSAKSAQIEFPGKDAAQVARQYDEQLADPVHAAKGGYLDDIVEPQFLKQYLIAALQTLVR